MLLRNWQILLLMLLPHIQEVYSWPYHPRVTLGTDQLFFPKFSSIKLSHTLSVSDDDKFYPLFVPKTPKRPKYLVGKLTDGWKALDGEKKEVGLLHSFRPVSIGFNSLPKFDEVKPVTEHIEGDLKYDFRTNTHSL